MRAQSLPVRFRHAGTLALLPIFSLLAIHAYALDITVSKTQDSLDGTCDQDCSLREALTLANATPGSHRIRLPAGTYQISRPPEIRDDDIIGENANLDGDLDVTGTLLITGAGSGATVIDGGRLDRIFDVLAGASLDLQRLTLRNGHHSHEGGAIRNHAELKLADLRVLDNDASHPFSGGRGGALANYQSLEVVRSVFERNFASFGDTTVALGGAIYNQGDLLVRDTAFRENRASGDDVLGSGGAIHNTGTADVARAEFTGNYADGRGAAITNEQGGIFKLSNATLSNNLSYLYLPVGAINNGAAYPQSSIVPQMQLVHVTIADNRGGYGLANFGKVSLRNSLIMGNLDETQDNSLNCINSGDYSFQARGLLLGTDGGNCVADLAPVDDATALTRVLFALDSNNSTLRTHALRRGSPAIDSAVGSCSSHDQRGSSRPRDGNEDGIAVCDIGAYERPKR